jgi:hypothetical protein
MPAFYKDPSYRGEESSAEVPMFFTRAQADALAAIFDQEYLRSLAPEAESVEPADTGVEVDEY